ncbi:FAD/NAD(P)-binding domain-containing protein, partial [Neoconidiobolus thromboides FSU 785]
KIVILGGGAAGSILINELSTPSTEIIMIDQKEYHEYIPSIIDVLLRPKQEDFKKRLHQICIPFKQLIMVDKQKKLVIKNHYNDTIEGGGRDDDKITIIIDQIVSVNENSVELLTNQQKIEFDKLIICTGSSYNLPFKSSSSVRNYNDRLAELTEYKQKIESSQKIACIGGGAVGIEMIAELVERYPNKRFYLVHNNNKLLSQFKNSKLSNNCEKALRDLSNKNNQNLTIIFDQKLKQISEKEYELEDGTKLELDLVIKSIGLQPNSEFMKKEMNDCLDEKEFIKVNNYFKVTDYDHIYALGDVSNLEEPKLYYTTHMQAIHLSNNLKLEMKNQSMKEYKNSKIISIISLGPSYAI